MAKEIITCTSCGSENTKMRTPVAATILIVLSGFILIDIVVRRTLDGALIGFVVLFIPGVLLWHSNTKVMCKSEFEIKK